MILFLVEEAIWRNPLHSTEMAAYFRTENWKCWWKHFKFKLVKSCLTKIKNTCAAVHLSRSRVPFLVYGVILRRKIMTGCMLYMQKKRQHLFCKSRTLSEGRSLGFKVVPFNQSIEVSVALTIILHYTGDL